MNPHPLNPILASALKASRLLAVLVLGGLLLALLCLPRQTSTAAATATLAGSSNSPIQVMLMSPAQGSTVSGIITLSANVFYSNRLVTPAVKPPAPQKLQVNGL